MLASYFFKLYIPSSSLSPYLIKNIFLSCKELLVAHWAWGGRVRGGWLKSSCPVPRSVGKEWDVIADTE